jgi:hypothetical protein
VPIGGVTCADAERGLIKKAAAANPVRQNADSNALEYSRYLVLGIMVKMPHIT